MDTRERRGLKRRRTALMADRPRPVSASPAALEPPTQGRLRFTGTSSSEKTLDTDVFVQIGPVNALAFADQPPVSPVGVATMCKPWIPRQRNGDGAPIDELNHQRVLGE